MKPSEEQCAVCGEVWNRYWMEQIGTGRNTHWMCPKCFAHGNRQADMVVYRPSRKPRREGEEL